MTRIAHLVGERGVRPERILALTFSRRVADEMSERVRERVPETVLVDTRTFHSFALSIARRCQTCNAGLLYLYCYPSWESLYATLRKIKEKDAFACPREVIPIFYIFLPTPDRPA